MKFEDIWQENKGFILGLLGGLIVFFTAYAIIDGSKAADVRSNLARVASSERRERGMRLQAGELQGIQRRREELSQDLGRLEKELAFRPAPGFTLTGVTRSPDIHFNETVQRLLVEVVEPAAALDIRIPADLGLGDVTPRTNEEREWYLNGLDVVNRICIAGMAGGVEAIEPIRIARVSKKSRRERNEVDPYLRSLTVSFSARGTPVAIDRLIRGLQIPGQRLVIEKARIQSLDGLAGKQKIFVDESLVVLDLTVKALLLDAEGAPRTPPVGRM
ncbi:MAG: hypothetical protein H6807_05800 [Planctomycetes bacterium]|nr:hypothetical protein [Planctomycetota bacterium]